MAQKSFITGARQKTEYWSKYKFAFLLASLVALFLVFPFLEQADVGRHLFIAAITLILVISIWVVSDNKRNMYIAITINIPTLLLNLAEEFEEEFGRIPLIYELGHLFLFASFAFTALVLFNHVLKARRVTHDEVLGAIAVYVLIAMAFSSLYLVADRFAPGSFIINAGPQANSQLTYSDCMYYSFGTITTAGTGTIVEVGPFVRSLSMIEAVIGLFYVAFIISKLVSSFEFGKA